MIRLSRKKEPSSTTSSVWARTTLKSPNQPANQPTSQPTNYYVTWTDLQLKSDICHSLFFSLSFFTYYSQDIRIVCPSVCPYHSSLGSLQQLACRVCFFGLPDESYFPFSQFQSNLVDFGQIISRALQARIEAASGVPGGFYETNLDYVVPELDYPWVGGSLTLPTHRAGILPKKERRKLADTFFVRLEIMPTLLTQPGISSIMILLAMEFCQQPQKIDLSLSTYNK